MKRLLAYLVICACPILAQLPKPNGGSGGGGTGAPNATFVWTGSSATGDIPHTFSSESAAKAVITCYNPSGVLLTGWTRTDPDATTIRITFGGAQAADTACNANATGTGATGATGAQGPQGDPGEGSGNVSGTTGAIAAFTAPTTVGDATVGPGVTVTAGQIAGDDAVNSTYETSASPFSGACTVGKKGLDSTNSDTYTCPNGTWIKQLKVGGVAASDIVSGDKAGTEAKVVTASAKGTTGNCSEWTATGLGDSGSPCGTGSGGGTGTPNVSAIVASGTSVTLTHNASLTNFRAVAVTCIDEDDDTVVLPSSFSSVGADALTVNFASTVTNVRCTVNTSGGSSPHSTLQASGATVVVTHNKALSDNFQVAYSCFDEDDGAPITPASVTPTTNAITFTWPAAVTNVRCTVP